LLWSVRRGVGGNNLVDINVQEHATVVLPKAADHGWRLTLRRTLRAVVISIAMLIATLVGLGVVFVPAFFAVQATAER
jgi:hypothetical protein